MTRVALAPVVIPTLLTVSRGPVLDIMSLTTAASPLMELPSNVPVTARGPARESMARLVVCI